MDEFESLSHSKWECKYRVVFIPKCRRRVLYGNLRQHLGQVFRKLAEQKESRIEEGHLLPDHVHMMIAIPPKYAVSQVVGFIKGKSAIHLHECMENGSRICGSELATFRWRNSTGAALATPQAASSGSQNKAPSSLPGDIYCSQQSSL